MRRRNHGTRILGATLLVLACLPALTASPPVYLNYQGVLRDSANNPLDGSYDMVFRFYDGLDEEILIDRHTASQGGAVTVSGGLFNVQLGAGSTADGSGPGSYTSLAEVFRDYNEVYLEVQIGEDAAPGTEVLSPRTRVVSAAYALNASNLAGVPVTSLLRSNESDVYTFGTLTLNPGTTLDVNGTLNMDGAVTKATTDKIVNLNADMLDDDDSTAFPRLGQNNTFSGVNFFTRIPVNDSLYGGAIAIDAPTVTDGSHTLFAAGVGGHVGVRIDGGGGVHADEVLGQTYYLNAAGPEGDGIVWFYDNGQAQGERFSWVDAFDRFQFSEDVLVLGDLGATGAKPFVQNHPYDSRLSIFYVALEGDEAGTYTRGSGRLVNGEARVTLGETFAWVTNPEIGLTAHITPRGKAADLYVESVSTTELVVRSREGAGTDVAFDYIVHGLRIGYEEFQTVQPRTAEAPLPSEAFYLRLREQHPELQHYTATARLAPPRPTADAANDGPAAARALREAIGEFDPGLDAPRRDRPEVDGAAVEAPVSSPAATDGPPLHARNAGSAVRAEVTEAPRLLPTFPVSEAVEPGDLLVLDPERPDLLRRCVSAADAMVIGIVVDDAVAGDGNPQVPVALSGVALVKADAGYGEIRPGDLLTSSFTPGHAMRAVEVVPGTIIGKALEPLQTATGRIKVLVMPR